MYGNRLNVCFNCVQLSPPLVLLKTAPEYRSSPPTPTYSVVGWFGSIAKESATNVIARGTHVAPPSTVFHRLPERLSDAYKVLGLPGTMRRVPAPKPAPRSRQESPPFVLS